MAVVLLLFILACQLGGLIVYLAVRDLVRGLRERDSCARKEHRHD